MTVQTINYTAKVKEILRELSFEDRDVKHLATIKKEFKLMMQADETELRKGWQRRVFVALKKLVKKDEVETIQGKLVFWIPGLTKISRRESLRSHTSMKPSSTSERILRAKREHLGLLPSRTVPARKSAIELKLEKAEKKLKEMKELEIELLETRKTVTQLEDKLSQHETMPGPSEVDHEVIAETPRIVRDDESHITFSERGEPFVGYDSPGNFDNLSDIESHEILSGRSFNLTPDQFPRVLADRTLMQEDENLLPKTSLLDGVYSDPSFPIHGESMIMDETFIEDTFNPKSVQEINDIGVLRKAIENLKKEAMEAQTDYAELEQKLAEVSDEKKASDDLLEVKTAECIDLSAKYIASIDEAYSSKEALLTELNELKDSHQMVKMQFDSTIKEKDNRLKHISMSNDAIETKFLEKSKECVAQSQQFEQAKSESNERAILLSKELSELKERLRDDTSEYQSTIQKIQRQLEETMVEKEVSDQLLEEKMKEGVYQAEKYDALAFQSKSKHELLSKELLSIKVSFENEKLGLESQIREKKKSFDDLTIEKEAINIQFLDKSNEYDSLVAESTKNFAIFEKKLTEGLELVEKLKKENAQFVTDIDKCEATLTSLLEELETTKKSKEQSDLSLKHAESELENEKVNSNALNDQIKKHQEEINEANEAQMKHLVLLQKKQHECDKLIETQKSVISEYGLKESIFKFEKGELLTRLKNVKDKLAAKEDELNDVMVKTKEEATKFRQKINSQEVLLEELQKAKEKFTITSHNYSVELQKKKEQITVAKDGLNFAKRKVKELGEYLDGFDADSKRRKSL